MRMLVLLVALLAAGCGDPVEYACVNGKLAHKVGKAWVIPWGAYDCAEVKP